VKMKTIQFTSSHIFNL